MDTLGTGSPAALDGRVRRGERNRHAIIEALVALYEDGVLRPTAAEVAARAGVSARSVHNHFADMETLVAEVTDYQVRRHGHLMRVEAPAGGPAEERVAWLVARRAELYEAVTPVRRAALLHAHASPTIARNLARAAQGLRTQLERLLAPELDALDEAARADLLEALDVLLSWEAWERLRTRQDLSVARAGRVLVAAVHAMLGPGG